MCVCCVVCEPGMRACLSILVQETIFLLQQWIYFPAEIKRPAKVKNPSLNGCSEVKGCAFTCFHGSPVKDFGPHPCHLSPSPVSFHPQSPISPPFLFPPCLSHFSYRQALNSYIFVLLLSCPQPPFPSFCLSFPHLYINACPSPSWSPYVPHPLQLKQISKGYLKLYSSSKVIWWQVSESPPTVTLQPPLSLGGHSPSSW